MVPYNQNRKGCFKSTPPPHAFGVVLLLSRGGESYTIVYQNFPLLFKGGVS
jgi:hypothetical protein